MISENVQGITYHYERYKTANSTQERLTLEVADCRIEVRDLDLLLAVIRRVRELPGEFV